MRKLFAALLFLAGMTVLSPALFAQSEAAASGSARAVRTITNDDLEPYRQKRLAADAADDHRRKEQGLPSREEVFRQQQERDERLKVEALQFEAARAEADARRAEADLNAYRNAQQNNYGAGQGDDYQYYTDPYLPYGYFGNYGYLGGNLRQRGFGFRDHEFSRFPGRRIYVAPRTATPMRGR